MSTWGDTALANAKPAVFWSDRPDGPEPAEQLRGAVTADLTIIGGGLTGLWTAIQALEEQPGLRVVLLEAERIGFGASSRNGGFCDSSLTHGLENGTFHWPGEIDTLVRMGRENLDQIEATLERYAVAADFQRTGEINVATQPWHLVSLSESHETHQAKGFDVELLDADAMQKLVASPTYLGGLARSSDAALVDPARLCWGLRAAAESLGATIYEQSPAKAIDDTHVTTPNGTVTTRKTIVATNAYESPIKQTRRYVVPVYDHVLMTEPLSGEQMTAIGWQGRQGLADASSQFHYYRLSEDNRILWGGWDATYHYGNGLGPQHDQADETHGVLARHFFETFPQLEGLGFSHRWGGPIATTTKFTASWGTKGSVTWVAGYTGLGVGASRFGARVALDLAFGQTTERTELEMVRKKPFPFPPEPLRYAGIQITRKAIQRSDDNEGRRGPWLNLLDKFGVGFDS